MGPGSEERKGGGEAANTQGSTVGARAIDTGIGLIENVLYIALSAILVGGAVLLLGAAGYSLATGLDEGVEAAVANSLDRLLLVFILVELLGAVRATIREHKLLAEPFLIVGLIATIKEIIVVLIDAKQLYGQHDKFRDSMTELGAIACLILVIAIASFLLRRKEREPRE